MSGDYEIWTTIRVISDENAAEMTESLATSAAPTPPGLRHIPIPLLDAPGWLWGRVGGRQRVDTMVNNAMVQLFGCLFSQNLGF